MSLRRNNNRRQRHLQQLFGSSRAYSPGCLTATVGQVYTLGAQVEIGFKYRLKLADATTTDLSSFLPDASKGIGEEPDDTDMVNEILLVHSEASQAGVIEEVQNITISGQDDTVTDLETAEEPQTVINLAQQILEKRIQDHLQDQLLYCPGSGADAKDLSIDGISVDLTSFHEPDECLDEAQTSCTLTGIITIFQRFHNIHGSSLQSTQAGLATLRIGMNEENTFVNEGDMFEEVIFLGGIIGISRQGQGSPGGGRDVSLNNGSSVSAVILSSAQSFIGTHAKKMSMTGQGIVGAFAMALLVLVVARRKVRNNNRGHDINEVEVDNDLESYSSEDDSWTDDGFGTDAAHNGREMEKEAMPPSVEVYLKREKKKNIFGFATKQRTDHVSVAGM